MLDEKLQEKIAAVVVSEGLELVHIEFKQGRKPFLRIYIDKPAGINHEDCKLVSDQVSVLLDVEDPIASSYILEVSSPGLERPLFRESDFKRFIGRRAKVRTKTEIYGRKSFNGKIAHAADGVVAITESNQSFEIPIASIEKANLQIEL
ncbi:MAG: ribosome maturation factor RimP [Acidobacteria bacterium]|nr:ribosome maturation factor RimP [Acidobacteriota bacterium]MBI3657309.1 ribosome maturation factor RimP [Acidobacteriota bacterium]